MISFGYLIFLIFIVIIFYAVTSKYQRYLLLLASLVFLGQLSIPFLLFALIFSLLNFLLGILIEKYKEGLIRRIIYLSGILIDIGVLIVFKYTSFFIDNINFIIDSFTSSEPIPSLSILLPIGISYYTFQCIGYIYRVYKNLEKAEKDIAIFTIYTLFFPKLLSGPIERSNHFIPQLHETKKFDQGNIVSGLQLILFGFFKKLVIGDNIGLIVSSVYGNLGEYSGIPLLLVMLLQPIHIYFDFSGYTDIALGSARLFGYKLTDNFNRPFFAPNVSIFWRRWHISLTAWCNDFIFKIILFKRRRWKDLAAVYSVFITFLIIGIWHGPRWNFIILGLLQGIAINYEFFTKKQRLSIARKLPEKLVVVTSRILTYLFFSFSLVFFFAPTFSDASYFLKNMFSNLQFRSSYLGIIPDFRDFTVTIIAFLVLLWIEAVQEKGENLREKIPVNKRWIRWSVYYVMIILILYLSKGENTFIYEQF